MLLQSGVNRRQILNNAFALQLAVIQQVADIRHNRFSCDQLRKAHRTVLATSSAVLLDSRGESIQPFETVLKTLCAYLAKLPFAQPPFGKWRLFPAQQ